MDDIWARFTGNLMDRVTGPMTFRLVMQPAMASFLAIRAGLNDAKAGRPPYLWSVIADSSRRSDAIKDGWKGVARVFTFAVVIDVAYQIVVARFVYPGEAVAVAFVLAIVPYAIIRGLTNRFARKK